MTWNPDQYHQFKEARSAPARDLQAMIPDQAFQSIVDLGCGTGEQTLQLAQRFSKATVLGIDSSTEMLAQAKAQKAHNLEFQKGDITLLDGQFDLIYSNAALQWIPDHTKLLGQLWQSLKLSGWLVVQIPSNHNHASHRLLGETADEFKAELGGYSRFGTAQGASPVLDVATYAELLDALGGQNITAINKVYPVVLDGAEGLIEWTRGTALVPYLSRLSEDVKPHFEACYLEKLKAEFPGRRLFYAFTRILFVAQKV